MKSLPSIRKGDFCCSTKYCRKYTQPKDQSKTYPKLNFKFLFMDFWAGIIRTTKRNWDFDYSEHLPLAMYLP